MTLYRGTRERPRRSTYIAHTTPKTDTYVNADTFYWATFWAILALAGFELWFAVVLTLRCGQRP